MSDTNLDPSITALTNRASTVAVTATARELMNISRLAPSLEKTENTDLEVAINARAEDLAPTATATELKSIGKAIGNVLEAETFVAGGTLPNQAQNSGNFLATNGTAESWGGLSVSTLSEVNISSIMNDETLVYNHVNGLFENNSQVFRIQEIGLTENIPASGSFEGQVVFDQQTSELKYWDGSEWKVAAVVAAAGAGGTSGVDWSSTNTTAVVTVTAPDHLLPKVQWGRSGAISGDYFCIADSENGGSYVGTLYIYRTSDGELLHMRSGTVSNGQQGVDNHNNGPVGMADDYIAISSGYYMAQDQVKIYQASTGLTVGTITRPSIIGNGDYFGTSVKMNEDASLLVVSAPFYGGNRGRVFVYDISDKNNIPDENTYTLLQSPTNGQGEYFGESVSITGTTVLTSSTKMPHKAYLFDATTGNVIATMERPGGYASGRFGRNVHVFDDNGSFISAIGCPTTAVGGHNEAGVVHVYDNTGSLIRSIENPNPTYSAWFGCVVRIVSSDTIVISERSNDDDGSGNNAGKVFIYSLTDGSLLSSLSNPYADGGPTQNTNMYRQFGFTMDVDPATGKILVVDRHSRGYIFEAPQASSGGGSGTSSID